MEKHEYTTWQELYEDMENNLDRYPLPLEFDEREELKQLNLRKMRLEQIAQRWFIANKRKKIISNFQNMPPRAKPYFHIRYKPE
jgi:hypothetical protein